MKNILIALIILSLALIMSIILAGWRIFVKAGRPGWKALIPFYGKWVFFEILGYNPWLSLTLLIPGINLIWAILTAFRLAKVFGKSKAFAFFGLFIFIPIGYLILAFSKAKYKKPRLSK